MQNIVDNPTKPKQFQYVQYVVFFCSFAYVFSDVIGLFLVRIVGDKINNSGIHVAFVKGVLCPEPSPAVYAFASTTSDDDACPAFHISHL